MPLPLVAGAFWAYRGYKAYKTVKKIKKARDAAKKLKKMREQAKKLKNQKKKKKECKECKKKKCLVGKYKDIKKACNARGGEAHHIVPDMAYRLGKSGSPGRIPGAPSHPDGAAICLSKAQHGSGPSGIHGRLRPALKAAGAKSPVPGTAPMGEILAASLGGLSTVKKVSPACKAKASTLATGQVANGPGLGAPGRTTQTLPNAAAQTVMKRGSY